PTVADGARRAAAVRDGRLSPAALLRRQRWRHAAGAGYGPVASPDLERPAPGAGDLRRPRPGRRAVPAVDPQPAAPRAGGLRGGGAAAGGGQRAGVLPVSAQPRPPAGLCDTLRPRPPTFGFGGGLQRGRPPPPAGLPRR